MKVVIYTRCSTYRQDHLHQLEALKELAKRNKWNVVECYSETISGTVDAKERKEFSALIDKLKKDKEIKKVLVWELSRLGRDARQIKNTLEDLIDMGVSTLIHNHNIETINPDGSRNSFTGLILSILAELSQMERTTIVERSVSGLRASAKSGKAGGGVFLGYGYKRDSDGKLVIDDEEAKVVRKIYSLLLEGNGTGAIAEILHKDGIPTKTKMILNTKTKKNENYKFKEGRWAGNTVLSIIKRTNNYGERKHKDLIISCPAIIDKETWENAQNQLKENYNENSRNTQHFYLLKGLLKCNCCDRNYVGKRRSDGSENYYHCSSKLRGVDACNNRGVGIYDLNSAVWFMLKYSAEVKGYAEKNLLQNDKGTKLKNLEVKIKFQKDCIVKKKKEIDKLIDLYVDGITSKEQVRSKIVKLEKELANLNRAERHLVSEVKTIEKTQLESEKSQKILEFIDLLNSSELKIQQILKSLLLRIVILNEPDRAGCGVSIYFKGVDYRRRTPFSFWVNSKTKTCGLADIEEYSYAHCLLTF